MEPFLLMTYFFGTFLPVMFQSPWTSIILLYVKIRLQFLFICYPFNECCHMYSLKAPLC
ncbi:hypothetical protein X975_08583, partial [Stegodyphus mimosarum]